MTYATNRSTTFVVDPTLCSEHWTFVGGREVQCLLAHAHAGPCEFMLAGKRMLDPRVPADRIPEFSHAGGPAPTFVGVERDHDAEAEDAIVDAAVEVV